MVSTEQFLKRAADPILDQAEIIFSQRQMRAVSIDPEILGEPGWDIMLCAFIAHRKGLVCTLGDVAGEIGLSPATTKRWIDLLTLREFLVQKEDFFTISEGAELKLSSLFKKQIAQMMRALSAFGAPSGHSGSL